ncbi:transglutaminase family protein [Rhizosphaericola mali]|uniref:transglutaminase family protein n=1 Tax=Rhizosphaericola mali TaxID=2545455 RepID=UPI001CD9BB4D|nr:transglutaminase family protein [Rhizosphaericola mali]
MKYKVIHKTTYTYSEPVSLCQNIALLHPRNTDCQVLNEYRLSISPDPLTRQTYEDAFGNNLEYFSIEEDHSELSVTSVSIIENDYKSVDEKWNEAAKISWKEIKDSIRENDYSILQFIAPTTITEFNCDIKEFAEKIFSKNTSFLICVKTLMQTIFTDWKFSSGFTTIATPPSEVFKLKKGVCQDFANLALACIRSLGLPARYVSGYIETIPPEGEKKMLGADASHAWFAVFVPNYGWFDFDPTNNKIPKEEYIVTSWGRDYFDVVPLKGVMTGFGENTMDVAVDVVKM